MADAAIAVCRKGVTVRLTLLAPIANGLGALQKGLGSLRERLGPTACDVLEIMQEREFVLSEAVFDRLFSAAAPSGSKASRRQSPQSVSCRRGCRCRSPWRPGQLSAAATDELPDGEFVRGVVEGAGCGLLLDLHNVYCNNLNGASRWTSTWRNCRWNASGKSIWPAAWKWTASGSVGRGL
jgi:hypothetical protein